MSNAHKSIPGSDQPNLAGVLRDCLASGIIIVDARQKIRAFNAGAERFTGVPSAQALNRDSNLLPAALRRVLNRVRASGKPVEDRQIALSTADGKITLRASAVPLQAGKARSGIALVLNDLVGARQFEQKLCRLDRLASIGTLSAGMTHEIKNALVSVKTFIDLLLDRNQDAELADVVRREMRRINSIVSQTLKFAGPARPTFSAIRLHDILDHSLRMVQPQIQVRLIALHRSFEAAQDIVRGDDYQLEQAFVNLLLNAVEAMSSSGSLSVATELVSVPSAETMPRESVPHIRVTVADTGVGISPENMGHLFEPFFTTKENGTGLGLAIARRIVEAHQGRIEVKSEINKGTTFNVLLPAHAMAG